MPAIDQRFEVWTTHQKLVFLERLSHSLTVTIRSVWSDPDLSPPQMLNQIKWINEIHHRVPAIAGDVRNGRPDRDGPDAGLDVEHWISQDEAIRGHIGWALVNSIEYADDAG